MCVTINGNIRFSELPRSPTAHCQFRVSIQGWNVSESLQIAFSWQNKVVTQLGAVHHLFLWRLWAAQSRLVAPLLLNDLDRSTNTGRKYLFRALHLRWGRTHYFSVSLHPICDTSVPSAPAPKVRYNSYKAPPVNWTKEYSLTQTTCCTLYALLS